MALSTLLIVGISAAVAGGAEEITSSVLKKNREEEMQKEQAKQATDQIKQQRAQASLASSEQATKRAQQSENTLAAQKVMAASRGTLNSPVFGSLVSGSASNFAADNQVAAMNLSMTNDNLNIQQLAVQRNLAEQEKSDNFNMWSGIGGAVVGTAGNIAGASTGYEQAKGARRAIDNQPGLSESDNNWSNQVPKNYFGS
jgi:mannitol-specific phosphotransferase system IIBC component